MFHFHKWIPKYDTEVCLYEECVLCGKRKVTNYCLGSSQKLNHKWLNGGKWDWDNTPITGTPINLQLTGKVRKF